MHDDTSTIQLAIKNNMRRVSAHLYTKFYITFRTLTQSIEHGQLRKMFKVSRLYNKQKKRTYNLIITDVRALS